MNLAKQMTMVVALLLGLAAPAMARTWRVEKDGSGDFTVIQAAVDAAAPGDTIDIGPGRFAEKRQFTCPGWTEDVYVSVTKDNLTLLGSGAGVTIIGPPAPLHAPPALPKAISAMYTSHFTASALTIENTADGVNCDNGYLALSLSTIQNCDQGIYGWTDGGMLVDGCKFINNNYGLTADSPAQNVIVNGCYFASVSGGLSFVNGVHGGLASNCEFHGGTSGANITVYSSAELLNCRFYGVYSVAVNVAIASSAILTGNAMTGGQANLMADSDCHVAGSGNVLSGGTYAAIVNCHSTMDFHGNHILNVGGRSVVMRVCGGPPDVQVDLVGNYWGTTDAATIANWIYDGHDDPNIHAFVQFEPFSGQPLGTESKTWGQVKTLYGR